MSYAIFKKRTYKIQINSPKISWQSALSPRGQTFDPSNYMAFKRLDFHSSKINQPHCYDIQTSIRDNEVPPFIQKFVQPPAQAIDLVLPNPQWVMQTIRRWPTTCYPLYWGGFPPMLKQVWIKDVIYPNETHSCRPIEQNLPTWSKSIQP